MKPCISLFFFLLTSGLASAGVLPDQRLTPGTTDPHVTQDNIRNSICVKGYTKKIRPPAYYTNVLKKKQIRQYGYADKNPKHYEEDHLIPLEVGGNPTDDRNLWPEPRYGQWSATKKDRLENKLHELVCNKALNLQKAQQEIRSNWISAYIKYITPAHQRAKIGG